MAGYFIKKIEIEGNMHLFLCRGSSHIVDSDKLHEQFLFRMQKHAILYKAGDRILKVCRAQSLPKDILRKYILNSQAEREFKSSEILSQLGLITPKSYFSAFSLFPLKKGWVESLHEMSFLKTYTDIGQQFMHQSRKNYPDIIRCFAKDMAVIANGMFCPKDLGLGNVMYNKEEGKIAWIDTDLKKFKNKSKLAKNIMAQLGPRFLVYLDSQESDLFWTVFFKHSSLFSDKEEMAASHQR